VIINFSQNITKSKSINENKYNRIINVLDAYVNNTQNDLDKFKERNRPSNIYDDKHNSVEYFPAKQLPHESS
jgi:hypothetical protein